MESTNHLRLINSTYLDQVWSRLFAVAASRNGTRFLELLTDKDDPNAAVIDNRNRKLIFIFSAIP